MPQLNYTYPLGIVGQVGTYATGDVVSVENPLNQQLSNIDVNGGTTDGAYTMSATDGRQTVTATFTASSNTAAQIAAGLVAAIDADPAFAGAAASATVVATDQIDILFQQAGLVWTVTMTADPSSGMVVTVTTAAGFTQVALGIILQGDTAGGFTVTYSNAALALGVTVRNADLVHPMNNPSAATGYDGPTMMGLVRRGEIYVQVDLGVTVQIGDVVLFNPTTAEWSNAVTGGFVAVPEAQWATSGTGVQRVYVNLPSET